MKKGNYKKRTGVLLGVAAAAILGTFIVRAADHIDAPGVKDTTADISDYYAFQGETSTNMVFVANIQPLLSPGATGAASFDENVMIEFNIDNDADNVEDLVIQCVFADGKVTAYGPVAPSSTGTSSIVETSGTSVSANITSYGGSAVIGSANGHMVFAGPRDDPFFMDFTQYNAIIAGDTTAFKANGEDTFAGTNVLSVVVEVPKSELGGTGTLNTWVEAKRKQ